MLSRRSLSYMLLPVPVVPVPCRTRAGARIRDAGGCSSTGATAGRRTRAIVTREQSNSRTAAGTLYCDAQNVGVVGGRVGSRRYPASVGCTSNRPTIGAPVVRPCIYRAGQAAGYVTQADRWTSHAVCIPLNSSGTPKRIGDGKGRVRTVGRPANETGETQMPPEVEILTFGGVYHERCGIVRRCGIDSSAYESVAIAVLRRRPQRRGLRIVPRDRAIAVDVSQIRGGHPLHLGNGTIGLRTRDQLLTGHDRTDDQS